MKDYKQMLEEALSKLPEEVKLDVRLEIPKPEVVVSGSQTYINNFIEIANIIRRKPEHLLKFLSKELASPAHIEGNRAIFQGKLYGSLIEKKLEAYYKEFLYCPECKKPDTQIIKQDRISLLKCEACGAKTPVRQIK
ncbi:MAG: translation initiation factor IF-2 subunit beta [Candidatus Aenigmatarchaeota archaeon]